MRKSVSASCALGLVLLIACSKTQSKLSPQDSLTGSSPGQTSSAPWKLSDLGEGRCIGVNSTGQVLGIDASNGTFIVGKDGARTTLGRFAADESALGTAISEGGQVAGYSQGLTRKIAIVYRGGAWAPVAPAVNGWSTALAIDRDGRIAGVRRGTDGLSMQAFVVSAGGVVDEPLSTRNSAAFGIQPTGALTGIVETPSGETHAFRLVGQDLQDLGSLGGPNSSPFGMNKLGAIVGSAEVAGGGRHAFLALPGAALTDLGVPPGAVTSEARGIDDRGRIAGNAYDAKGLSRPVVFLPGSAYLDLLPRDSAQPYASAHAVGMSPDGKIAGWGVVQRDTGAEAHCLLWTPQEGEN